MTKAKRRNFQKPHNPHPKIVLLGQPNCGKSTIYNKVAGYKSISTNFPGATVSYNESHLNINGQTFDLIDLPGTYSLTSMDAAEEETKKLLLNEKIDVIINIVDASILGRSLELTLELIEFGVPVVLCLNMMDEAQRKGVHVDRQKLSNLLGLPVVETIASQGHGVDELFRTALEIARSEKRPKSQPMTAHVQHIVDKLADYLKKHQHISENDNPQLFSTKLLESDGHFQNLLSEPNKKLATQIQDAKDALFDAHGLKSEEVISAERHALAMRIFEAVAEVTTPRKSRRDRLDDWLLHPILGYLFMLVFLFAFFNLVFRFGAFSEGYILDFFNTGLKQLLTNSISNPLTITIIDGVVQGLAGGVAIVIPYLVPFLIGLALLEDFGYLPRIAFLMDRFMHKIGLHGTAVIPGMLGYGCSVPAIMATRILSSPRDRFIASVVAVLIPCSARMIIILGLVGYYLGGTAAFGIYIFNLFFVSLVGSLLSRMMPEDTPGMILEMPSYQVPSVSVIMAKTWLRLKDFIIIAWPILIAGSAILSLAQFYHMEGAINRFLSPITILLGLPIETGTTLIFGILRKELSMLLLFQALGTSDVMAVLSQTQILVFTLFVVFYIPCLATLGILYKEIGWRRTVLAAAGTFAAALVIGLAGRLFGTIFL